MWDLIVSVPDHCLSFYFATARRPPVGLLTTRITDIRDPSQVYLVWRLEDNESLL